MKPGSHALQGGGRRKLDKRGGGCVKGRGEQRKGETRESKLGRRCLEDQRQQKVVVCSNGEANGEVISVEFEEWIFELNPACLRQREDSIQNGGMNFVGGRDTYEGGLFWEGQRRSRAA